MLFQDKSSATFFEAKYRAKADPWDFAHSPYELARYDAVMAAVSGRRYRRTFEPGCAVGVLTERLAAISDSVQACDFSETAVGRARARCADLPNVTITCGALAMDTSFRGFDLIVVSEIGYYFKLPTWIEMASRFAASMDPGATLLASHWLGQSKDHRISGDAVHEALRASPLLRVTHEERHEAFRLDRFVRL